MSESGYCSQHSPQVTPALSNVNIVSLTGLSLGQRRRCETGKVSALVDPCWLALIVSLLHGANACGLALHACSLRILSARLPVSLHSDGSQRTFPPLWWSMVVGCRGSSSRSRWELLLHLGRRLLQNSCIRASSILAEEVYPVTCGNHRSLIIREILEVSEVLGEGCILGWSAVRYVPQGVELLLALPLGEIHF